jgi:hypothetical protein
MRRRRVAERAIDLGQRRSHHPAQLRARHHKALPTRYVGRGSERPELVRRPPVAPA